MLFKVIKESTEATLLSDPCRILSTMEVELSEGWPLFNCARVGMTRLPRDSKVWLVLLENESRPLIAISSLVDEELSLLIAKGANSVKATTESEVFLAFFSKFSSGVRAGVSAIAFNELKTSDKELFGADRAVPSTVRIGAICGKTLVTLICLMSASPM